MFIHCGSANRVGAVWLVKRVLQDGWTVPKATEEAKMIGLRSAPLEQFALKVHRGAQEIATPAAAEAAKAGRFDMPRQGAILLSRFGAAISTT